MKVAICQPTYLPWIGYFDLIDSVDVFVFLDTVQFSKQSWQQRNRIRSREGLQWLTIPVKRGGLTQTPIHDVLIAPDADFPRSHLRTLEVVYGRAPFFSRIFEGLRAQYDQADTQLSVLNMRLIRWMASELGVTASFITASELNCTGHRTELLVKILTQLHADTYLSPFGSTAYLAAEAQLLEQANIEICFQHYEPQPYRQVTTPFIPYTSAIDLLLNEGPHALEILRAGHRAPFTLSEAKERFDHAIHFDPEA